MLRRDAYVMRYRVGHEPAVADAMVALVAQERDAGRGLARQTNDGLLVARQVLGVGGEEALIVAIAFDLVAQWFGRP